MLRISGYVRGPALLPSSENMDPAPVCVILEDDAILVDRFADRLSSLLEELPRDIHFCFYRRCVARFVLLQILLLLRRPSVQIQSVGDGKPSRTQASPIMVARKVKDRRQSDGSSPTKP